MPALAPLVTALRALADLAAPQVCAVCGASAVRICTACETACAAAWFDHGPRVVGTLGAGAGDGPCVSAGPFEAELRSLAHAYKDGDRRDLDRLLAPGLLASVVTVLAVLGIPAGADVVLVPAPSSRAAGRRRGDRPVERLARLAAGAAPSLRLRVVPALVVRRRVADQSALGRRARARNVEHAFAGRGYRPVESLFGATVLVVDDIWTTGATARECARALADRGLPVAGAATVLATPLLHPRREGADVPAPGARGVRAAGRLVRTKDTHDSTRAHGGGGGRFGEPTREGGRPGTVARPGVFRAGR